MKRIGAVLTALAFVPCVAASDTVFSDLTASERGQFHREIRAVLLERPEIVADALRPPTVAAGYGALIADDVDLIARHAPRLFSLENKGFGPRNAEWKLALFLHDDCPDCDRALADLERLAQTVPIRVSILNTTENAALADAIGADQFPFYVMPRMMVRGHVPPVVLERYLLSGTGQ